MHEHPQAVLGGESPPCAAPAASGGRWASGPAHTGVKPARLAACLLTAALMFAAPARAEHSLVRSWGAAGSADGAFNAPQGIAIGLGDVFVVESGNQRVQRFRATGAFDLKWGNPDPAGSAAPGRFNGPEGIAADSDGAVYVADTRNDRIQKFTPEGVLITSWGTQGTAPGQFSSPTAAAIGEDRSVYVADLGSARIQKFTSDGTFVRAWGTDGPGQGQFNWLAGVAAGPGGDVYTVELEGHRVQHFSADGTFLGEWGGQGSEAGRFLMASAIAVGGRTR